MASFKDKEDREWVVVVDVPQLKAVRERCKFELGKILKDDMAGLKELAAEPILFVDVLFVLCAEQAAKQNVAPESFGRAMHGEALEAAWEALMEAYADFCPPQQRKVLRALLAKTQEYGEAAMVKVMKGIEELDVNSILNASRGSAAESAESVRALVG